MTGLNYVRLFWGEGEGWGVRAGWNADSGVGHRRRKAGRSSGAGSRRIPPHMTSGPYHERPVSRARLTSGPCREPALRAARITSPPHTWGLLAHCRAAPAAPALCASLAHPCGGFGTEASRTPSATASEIVGETTLAPTSAVNICCRSRPSESPRPALIWLIDFVMSPTI